MACTAESVEEVSVLLSAPNDWSKSSNADEIGEDANANSSGSSVSLVVGSQVAAPVAGSQLNGRVDGTFALI